MNGVAEGYYDSGSSGLSLDKEKRDICSTSSKMKMVYGPLSFPSFLLTQVKFGKKYNQGQS